MSNLLESYGCHPNFAGVSFGTLDLSAAGAAAKLKELKPAVEQLRKQVPQALSQLGGIGSAKQLAAAAATSTAPIVSLTLEPAARGDFSNVVASLAEAWQETGLAAVLARYSVCNSTAASLRFQTYAALLFGAKGLTQVGCGTAAHEQRGVLAAANADVVHWGNDLLGLRTVSVHSTASFAVAGATPLPASGTALVQSSVPWATVFCWECWRSATLMSVLHQSRRHL